MEVDDVIAHAMYDPAARRARYLKTRQLKGRQPPAGPVHIQPIRGTRGVDGGTRIRNPKPPSAPTGHVNRTAVSQAASNARQVAVIKGRLSDLKAHLAELLAKKKSSSSSDSSKSAKEKKSSDSKPKTAKQKAAAAKALKEAQKERAKDAKKEPDKQEGGTSLSIDEQITKTRAVITDVETKLRAAIDSARTQTASNGR